MMGSRRDTVRAEQSTYHFPSSPATPTSPVTPTRSSFDSHPFKDKSFPPHGSSILRASSHKVYPSTSKWPDSIYDSPSDGSGTETKQGRTSPQLCIRRKTPRRKSERSLTVPSARTVPGDVSHASPRAGRPLSRRSSSASSSSSSNSPDWNNHQSSSTGIGRKVAASLDLFKESSTPASEEPNPFDFNRPLSAASRHRKGSSHQQQLEDVGEAQFEFVKRSDWPDREAAAVRREKSATALERVRTRDSASSVSSVRDVDARRRKERQSSMRDSMMVDLGQWRKAVAAQQDDGRGRPRERTPWSEDQGSDTQVVGSPGTDSSLSSAGTYHEKSDRGVASPYRQSRSSIHHPHHSPSRPHDSRPHDNEVSPVLPSSLFVSSPEHEVPPPASLRRDRSRSPTPVASEPLVDTSLPEASNPLLPSPVYSPWSSDEDEDDESNWETASATTTTSTTSASSPFPLSPLRTSPAPQPLVRQPSYDDVQQQRGLLPLLEGDDLDHAGLHHTPPSDEEPVEWGFNLSQESLPHIPLRPFRNQVGGHSAIYKFTKRAVCKVSRY